jgi:hypothetical protein
MAEGHIKLLDWEDCIADGISTTIGEGSDAVFEMLCEEEQFLHMAFQRGFCTELPTLSDIVHLFFGPDSKIFHVFKDTIKINHGNFIKFMKTFCIQTSYRVSCTELFDKNSYLDMSSLCLSTECISIWQIGKACIPKDPKSSTSSTDTLWMQLEDARNGLLQEFAVEVFLGGQAGDNDGCNQGFGLHLMITKCTGMEQDTIMLGCRIHGMYVTIIQVLFAIMVFCQLPACFWQSSLTIKVTQQRPVASK